MTILELLGKSTPWLAGKGSESAKADAEILLAKVLKLRRIDLFLKFEQAVTTPEQDAFRELMRRRATGEPVAYLTGSKGFHDFDVEVGPGVLVPRPETETLVDLALARGGAPRPVGAPALRILDVGTGSGCIAIALARGLPDSDVTAIELAHEAVIIARRNIAALAPERVRLLEGDGFAPVAGEAFDLVVANPPYIAESERASLPRDVRDFEPGGALFSGADGLTAIRAWAAGAYGHLTAGGWALFEIGSSQREAASAIFRDAGFVDIAVSKDLSGQDRVVSGRK